MEPRERTVGWPSLWTVAAAPAEAIQVSIVGNYEVSSRLGIRRLSEGSPDRRSTPSVMVKKTSPGVDLPKEDVGQKIVGALIYRGLSWRM